MLLYEGLFNRFSRFFLINYCLLGQQIIINFFLRLFTFLAQKYHLLKWSWENQNFNVVFQTRLKNHVKKNIENWQNKRLYPDKETLNKCYNFYSELKQSAALTNSKFYGCIFAYIYFCNFFCFAIITCCMNMYYVSSN